MSTSRLLGTGVLVIMCQIAVLSGEPLADGATVKSVLDVKNAGENLLKPGAWRAYEQGFERQENTFVCDNATDAKARRGVSQSIELNQTKPQPIVAVAWSKAEGVGSSSDSDYSLYLDLLFSDGTPLWGQTGNFSAGSHDWERREVTVLPEKPVKSVTFNLLLRRHSGRAFFRDAELRQVVTLAGACLFDGVPVVPQTNPAAGYQVRDVAAGSDFVRLERQALGLTLDAKQTTERGAEVHDATVADTTGKDRAVSLLYAIPIAGQFGKTPDGGGWRWLSDPRRSEIAEPLREYVSATNTPAGANGRISHYPLAAITDGKRGVAIGIDMDHPAFFRVGFNTGTRELFLAYDIGLAPEKPQAHVRFCVLEFEPAWGFRAALARYHALFPEQFRCRTPEQGLWMPFGKISKVENWEDFGFKFKEGNDETKWDDEHGIITFRYTEPMTWWMRMAKGTPRTLEAALAEAQRLADKGDSSAKALLASGYHDSAGRVPAQLLDTPWCDGAVWSMNSMPGIQGEYTDFKNKWNEKLREQLYGPKRNGDLDGEYVDSSEGYVTDWLDYRREHFAAAATPLTFARDSRRPAIFRGLIAFEYVRAIAKDVHGVGKLMMANGAPDRLPWLAPMLEVTGTETDWNHGGTWRPMSDADMLYRRALTKGKPYCFLMNTDFGKFSYALVEKYMQRSLAYGMFPGFFSGDASSGQYFTRPELYNRDRPLFKKYVPLCKRVAEAGWEAVTRVRSSDEKVYVERFGESYLTVFNDSPEKRTVTITLEGKAPAASHELLSGAAVEWKDNASALTLEGEGVAVVEMK
ncbi:MAG: hypothetical protein ABSE73_05125 [Planctomycetota bacterium]